MAQQTAVSWLTKELEKQGFVLYDLDIKKAKQMEKEQIMKANVHGFNECANYVEITSEQYYNETYENNK